jgi:kynurenine formamidase
MPLEADAMDAQGFDNLREEVSNWGRWGARDERGAHNLMTAERVVQAARFVHTGRVVSLAHDLDTSAGPDNPKPALHYMTQRSDVDQGEPRVNMDFIGTDFHGKSVTHLDALCHCNFRGQLFNGVKAAESVDSTGGGFGSVLNLSAGLVAKAVLLDVPRSRGVDWLEPGTAVGVAELQQVADDHGVQPGSGDMVFVRTGHRRRRDVLGAWDPSNFSAGVHPRVMWWLRERDVAVLGGDGDSDARPSPVPGVDSPIHALALATMGVHLVDNMNLEDLARACEEERRWEFFCVVAPLRVPGGTGSPVNPIAVF